MISKKLLKYFNGTDFFTPTTLISTAVSPIRLALYLNEEALLSLVTFALLSIGSLLKLHKLLELSE